MAPLVSMEGLLTQFARNAGESRPRQSTLYPAASSWQAPLQKPFDRAIYDSQLVSKPNLATFCVRTIKGRAQPASFNYTKEGSRLQYHSYIAIGMHRRAALYESKDPNHKGAAGVLGLVAAWGLLPALSLTASGLGAPLMAGVARVDITPPPGLPMYGYFLRIKDNQPSTGTLDPLYARVLVLAVGQERLALVTLDLGRTFGKGLLDQLQQEASKRDGISYLVVTASHTHAGPNISTNILEVRRLIGRPRISKKSKRPSGKPVGIWCRFVSGSATGPSILDTIVGLRIQMAR